MFCVADVHTSLLLEASHLDSEAVPSLPLLGEIFGPDPSVLGQDHTGSQVVLEEPRFCLEVEDRGTTREPSTDYL